MDDSPFVTHVGVFVCVEGDRAAGSARFSFLRWEPTAANAALPGCGGSRERPSRTARSTRR